MELEELLNKESNKERNPLLVSVHLRVSKKQIKAIDNIVKETGGNRTQWIRDAISRGLKNWKNPLENREIWPRCRHCNKRHDPATHGLDDE